MMVKFEDLLCWLDEKDYGKEIIIPVWVDNTWEDKMSYNSLLKARENGISFTDKAWNFIVQ